tara:strand:+ start:106 stop:948 length:843 start_codon:yes stop_codon:yes gene_type:complete
MTGTLVLFDGDIIAYRAGFAAEKRVYFDIRNPPEKGGSSFSTKKEALKEVDKEHLDYQRDLEPLENALQNAKSLINGSLEVLKDSHGMTDVKYVTFISGNDQKPNFRAKVDPEYKANRDPKHKPTYLKELVDYLVKNHGGFVTQGCEADDFFGHAQSDAIQNGMVPVIVSIDKDLAQLPGIHYNLVKNELVDISKEDATLVFWRQMLEGDSVDNIKGVVGIGKVKAKKYIPAKTTDEEAKKIVTTYYQRDHDDDWEKEYNKNCDLLWIWRKIPDECPHKV